ncbi:hypothetical protein JRQ81_017495 [Phrynocephalus forsythii]|uniref:Transmembrane protein n=1 Tax=Phrynocephalus forsythii TaxID=171643 RepID=A0A9Q1B0J5_9SAUR|nr:hypothetical protein JRQ81_017495 [Phrynocephalus forsythii]
MVSRRTTSQVSDQYRQSQCNSKDTKTQMADVPQDLRLGSMNDVSLTRSWALCCEAQRHLRTDIQRTGVSQKTLKTKGFLVNMSQVTFWNVLEYFCRLLGISTGAVLLGVGTDTLLQGQFKSLGTYLLISGAAVSACEVAYFVSLLVTCSSTKQIPVNSALGGQAASCGTKGNDNRRYKLAPSGSVLSVSGGGGTMLVLTGLAYFVLSKQQKETRANGEEQGRTAYNTAVSVTGRDDPGQTYLFCKAAERGRGSSFAGYLRNFFKGGKEQGAVVNPSSTLSEGKQRCFEDKVVDLILSVREDPEEPESLAEESTSDTAPSSLPSCDAPPNRSKSRQLLLPSGLSKRLSSFFYRICISLKALWLSMAKVCKQKSGLMLQYNNPHSSLFHPTCFPKMDCKKSLGDTAEQDIPDVCA